MKRINRIIPFILVLVLLFYLVISNWRHLNAIALLGYLCWLIVIIYQLYMVITEKYIDFRDHFKIKRISIDKDSSSTDKNI